MGRNNDKFKYHMNGRELEETEEEKDLGVWITNTLKPEKQVSMAVKTALVVPGPLKTLTLKLFKSLIAHM